MKNSSTTEKTCKKMFTRLKTRGTLAKRTRKERRIDWTIEPWAEFAFHKRPGKEDFRVMRRDVLRLTQAQCADILGVCRNTVHTWESGEIAVPFMAYHLPRLVLEHRSFRFAHTEWGGWCISREGKLCSPDHRYEFTPSELADLWIRMQVICDFEKRLRDLNDALQAAQRENTELRALFVNQGVVDEVANMRERLNDLMARLNTAKVIPFPAIADTEKKAVG